MAFQTTDHQTPQPEELQARLSAALGSAEVHFHPEAAPVGRLIVPAQLYLV